MTSFWKHNLLLVLPLLTLLVVAPACLGASSFVESVSPEVLSPYTFKEGNGNTYKLYGIHILDEKADPKKYAAVQKITTDFMKAPFTIEVLIAEPDRYGFYDVILWDKDKKKSLQETLLENGLTKIALTDKTLKAKYFKAWKAAEQKSTFDGFYTPKKSTDVTEFDFQIVRDKVVSLTERKDFTFINFGMDWKEDFTIMIPKGLWKKIDKTKFEAGKTIQVRGFTENYYGPMIKLESDRQLD